MSREIGRLHDLLDNKPGYSYKENVDENSLPFMKNNFPLIANQCKSCKEAKKPSGRTNKSETEVYKCRIDLSKLVVLETTVGK